MVIGHPSPRPLSGRCALVTGSSAGLGYAIAEGLASAGCDVALHGLESEAAAEASRRDIEERHRVRAGYVRSDLATERGAAELLDAVRNGLGAVDILVNNAVVRHFAPVDRFPAAAWDKALAVNLSAAFHLVRLALPAMRARGWGRVINMTSVYGERGTVNRVDYVTTKSGLLGFTRAVAMETLSDGITCNAVCPGSVLTPGTETRVAQIRDTTGADRAEAERKFLERKQPSGRFIRAEDVAAVVVFLCTPAARDITGTVLPVDGGWLAS
jgi:3-hydroxybutyrate dehydrogenase